MPLKMDYHKDIIFLDGLCIVSASVNLNPMLVADCTKENWLGGENHHLLNTYYLSIYNNIHIYPHIISTKPYWWGIIVNIPMIQMRKLRFRENESWAFTAAFQTSNPFLHTKLFYESIT